MSCDLEKKTSIIKAKYLKACYPEAFLNSVINNFDLDTEEDFLIPPILSEEQNENKLQVRFCKRSKEKN